MPSESGQRARWWSFGGNFAWAASLFLAGLAAKLALIAHHGSSFPYGDQWPSEGADLFTPYFTGKLALKAWFAPHNEHRILFTRICELGLLVLNGQWDNLVEMTVDAVIYCAGVAGLGWVLVSLLGKKTWPLVWVLLVLDLALPFAWENTLWGFQSQFYFLCIAAWLTIWLLALNDAWTWRWWLGVASATGSLFTMAPAFLAVAAVVAVTVMVAQKQPKEQWKKFIPTWAVCGMLIVAGLLLKGNPPLHELDQARNIPEFFKALGKALAWPWAIWAWYAPLNLLPLLTLGWIRRQSAQPLSRAEMMIFGLAIWAGLQALAGAFARGVFGNPPAWRYMDVLSFLTVTNFLAIYILLNTDGLHRRFPILAYTGLAVWMIGCLSGLGFVMERVWVKFLPEFESEQAVRLADARAFLATGNPDIFNNEVRDERPVPSVDFDVWVFRNPYLRAVFPACLREPLRVVPATNNDNTFIRSGWLMSEADPPTEVSWGSYSEKKEAARGTFESQPVQASRLPYLEIPVAGNLGAPGLSLELIELNSGEVTKVIPPYVPGGTWENVRVRAPAGAFKIVASDQSDTGWFAFKEPRELGGLSYWTVRLLPGWKYLAVLGIGGFLLNLTRVSERKSGAAPDLGGR